MFGVLSRRAPAQPYVVEVQESNSLAALPTEMQREVARHLPLLEVLGKQLQGTAEQIEQAVVGVCSNFQQIAEQARSGVSRAAAFLTQRQSQSSKSASIEGLIAQSRTTFESLLATLEQSAKMSQRAVEHMRQIDLYAQKINDALRLLGEIASGNHILALNARIEAARAGEFGKGFEVVATEVVTQTNRSHSVIAEVTKSIQALRSSASSALTDLTGMGERGLASAEAERIHVEKTLQAFNDLDCEMRTMLQQASEDGVRLSQEIGKAVNGMQFQDRVNQRLDHVVQGLKASEERLAELCGDTQVPDTSFMDEVLARYTMHEERSAANRGEAEAAGGDVELF